MTFVNELATTGYECQNRDGSGLKYTCNIRAASSVDSRKNSMARDPQAALTALNRFGFGARGGASGDLAGAASDPRGFVKADLYRPNNARLEMPGLQPTPALALAVFAYQAEVKAAREAAKANPAAEMPTAEKPAAMDAPDKPLENKSAESKSMDNQSM